MKTLSLILIGALSLISTSCANRNIKFEGSYLNDLSGTDPFGLDNGKYKTATEGLEGSKYSILIGGEIYRYESIRVDMFGGPSILAPNGSNYVGRPSSPNVDKDDDSWTFGMLAQLDIIWERSNWICSPLISIGGGAHYSHHQWDGQGKHYLFNFNPMVGLEFNFDWLIEGARLQTKYGIDHYSNGRGTVRKSNDGRNTDIFTVGISIPF